MSLVILILIGFTFGSAGYPSPPLTVRAGERVLDPCNPLSNAKRLPPIDLVLDTLALHALLATEDTTLYGEVIVSIWQSTPPRGYIVEGEATGAEPGAVVGYVLSSLRPAPKGLPPAFRVAVQRGRAPQARLDASVLCKPEPLEKARTVRVPFSTQTGGRAPTIRSVTPRIRISPNGEVLEVDLGLGSGDPELDRGIREAERGRRYSPARLDGRPVEAWLRGTSVELVR